MLVQRESNVSCKALRVRDTVPTPPATHLAATDAPALMAQAEQDRKT